METNLPKQVSWTINVEEDPETGEIILPLPADMLIMQGWFEGDTLEWQDNQDGSWTLTKIEPEEDKDGS